MGAEGHYVFSLTSLTSVGSPRRLTREHLARHLPDEAKAETVYTVAWSPPSRGITEDLRPSLNNGNTMNNNKVRVKLKFTRKVTQVETGYVTVDVPTDGTVADAYREAYAKQWTEYLPREKTVLNEDWVYQYKEDKANGRTEEPA